MPVKVSFKRAMKLPFSGGFAKTALGGFFQLFMIIPLINFLALMVIDSYIVSTNKSEYDALRNDQPPRLPSWKNIFSLDSMATGFGAFAGTLINSILFVICLFPIVLLVPRDESNTLLTIFIGIFVMIWVLCLGTYNYMMLAHFSAQTKFSSLFAIKQIWRSIFANVGAILGIFGLLLGIFILIPLVVSPLILAAGWLISQLSKISEVASGVIIVVGVIALVYGFSILIFAIRLTMATYFAQMYERSVPKTSQPGSSESQLISQESTEMPKTTETAETTETETKIEAENETTEQ